MTSYLQPFQAEYSSQGEGMTLSYGQIPNLRDYLEIFGSGLETSGEIAAGGPLVAPLPQSTNTVLAWIQGVPTEDAGRLGTWEAWGVVAEAEADAVRLWPWFWDELRNAKGRENLETFARHFERQERSVRLPEPPQNLLDWLACFHLQFIHQGKSHGFFVPVNGAPDLRLLPWLWLLGPVPFTRASVGPARRNPPVIVNPPLTYEGHIYSRSVPDRTTSALRIKEAIHSFQSGDIEKAFGLVKELHEAGPQERLRLLNEPRSRRTTSTAPASAKVMTEAKDSTPPPEGARPLSTFQGWFKKGLASPEEAASKSERKSGFGNLRRVLRIQTLLLGTSALLLALGILQGVITLEIIKEELSDVRDELNALNAQSQRQAAPSTPTQTGSIPDIGMIQDALSKRLNLKTEPSFIELLAKKTATRNSLAAAAVQIYLQEQGCAGASELPIDGLLGADTQKVAQACSSSQEVSRYMQSEDEALKWLSEWLGTGPQ